MSQVWLHFADAAEAAKMLARARGECVDIRRTPSGWEIPEYCSWVGELDCSEPATPPVEKMATTGLAPPDWEDHSPDEVDVSAGGAYVHGWDAE